MKRSYFKISFFYAFLFLSTLVVYGQKKGKKSQAAKLRDAEFYFVEGQKYFILEDYGKALPLFEKSRDINPHNATVYYAMSQVYAKGNDVRQALEKALKALKLDDSNPYFYVQAANLYVRMGDYSGATEIHEKLADKIADAEIYLFELAALYLYQYKYDDALKTYDKIERFYGISEEISYQKQKIFLQNNQLEEAIAEGRKLIEAYPEEEAYAVKLAEILLSNAKENEAAELLTGRIRDYPDSYKSKLMLAELKRKNGYTEEALRALKEVFEYDGFGAEDKINLLVQYRSLLAPEELFLFALPLGEILADTHKDIADAHIVLGDLYQQLRRPREAKSQYVRALELDPSVYGVWQNTIQLYFQLGEVDSVIYRSEQALELFPNQSMLYYFNGAANLQQGHHDEAVYALEQGRKLSSANLSLLHMFNAMLGDAYNNIEEYAKSDEAYEAALDFDPTNDAVLNNYSYFLALRKENLGKAEQMIKQVIDRNPKNVTFLDSYAWVLFMREKFKEARKVMEKAIAIGGVEAIHYEHYGDILFKLGEVDKAVEQWQVAKGMNPDAPLIDEKIADRKFYE